MLSSIKMKAILQVIHELEDAELDLTLGQLLGNLDIELDITEAEVEGCIRHSLDNKWILGGETSVMDGREFYVRRLTLRGREAFRRLIAGEESQTSPI